MHDDYKPLDTPQGLERCPVCGSEAGLWQYSESETAPRKLLVMCSHGDRIGPQDGLIHEGCLLYMPDNNFYRETIRDAVRFWNEFAKALSAFRRQNNWKHAQPLRGGSLLRPALKPGDKLVCYCPPGVCQALKGFSGPCNRATDAGVNVDAPAQPQSDLLRALELGRAHAKWSVDRSKDAIERRMNQHDLNRIDAALAAALGVGEVGRG